MLSVAAATTTATSASKRDLIHGLLISWLKTVPSSVNFFTINQSKIGGPDKIKSTGGGTIAFLISIFIPTRAPMLRLGKSAANSVSTLGA